MQPNRLQMYALILAFERDLRDILDQFVVNVIGESETLGEFIEEAEARRARDGGLNDSLLEWLDLRPEYELLNRHRDLLPSGLSREIRELTSEVDVVEPIRHTVMHGRPLRPQDPERLFTALSKYAQPHWSQLKQAIRTLNQNATWTPEESLPTVVPGRIRHNLPLPDYDETGILGRDSEIEQICSALKRRRESVITLTGEGGIGKSAIALETAYRLLDDPDCPFDMILWVSLKTERLTPYGIDEVVNKVDSLTGATQVLGEAVADSTFNGGLEALSEAVGSVTTLIIFDNLETISGDEFVRLYESLPGTVSFLVTSRNGIGQIERRYPIGPLAQSDGLSLLNQLIRIRRVEALRSISGETRKTLAERLRYSPLAIRWYVLSVEAGMDPLKTIRDQDDLVNYCVSSVYRQVSSAAQLCLHALHLISRPVLADDIVVLTQLTVQEVHTALQELIRGSLVTHTTSNDLRTLVLISETANVYLNRHLSADDPIRASVEKLETELTRYEVRRQEEENRRSLAPIVIRTRDSNDRPVAFILREALLASQDKDMTRAFSKVEEAKELNPDFWEVWRVDAFLHAQISNSSASSRYRRAYELAETDEQRAVVGYFFSGYLARNEHNLEEAVALATMSHDVLDLADTARALGNLLIWQSKFEDGLELLQSASTRPDSRGKTRMIVMTGLVDGYRRKGEHALEQNSNPLEAWNACWTGWNLGLREVDRGTSDARLLDTLIETATLGLRFARIADANGIQVNSLGAMLHSLHERRQRFATRLRRLEVLIETMKGLFRHTSFGALSQKVASELNEQYEVMTGVSGPGLCDSGAFRWLPGTIVRVMERDGYGFLTNDDFPSNVFFHRSSLPATLRMSDLTTGDRVEWVHENDHEGRDRASQIRLLSDREGPVRQDFTDPVPSPVHKDDLPASVVGYLVGKPRNTYVFAVTDEPFPRVVFLHKTSFSNDEDFDAIDLGDFVRMEIEQSADRGWQATSVEGVIPLLEQSS